MKKKNQTTKVRIISNFSPNQFSNITVHCTLAYGNEHHTINIYIGICSYNLNGTGEQEHKKVDRATKQRAKCIYAVLYFIDPDWNMMWCIWSARGKQKKNLFNSMDTHVHPYSIQCVE